MIGALDQEEWRDASFVPSSAHFCAACIKNCKPYLERASLGGLSFVQSVGSLTVPFLEFGNAVEGGI